MASKNYVESQLNQLADEVKRVLVRVFEYVLTTLSLGGVAHRERAVNFSWYRLDSTTATTANEEFSILHSIGQKPRWVVMQGVDMTSSGGQIVRLRCTRAADEQRIYLASPDTNAQFTVFVEV